MLITVVIIPLLFFVLYLLGVKKEKRKQFDLATLAVKKIKDGFNHNLEEIKSLLSKNKEFIQFLKENSSLSLNSAIDKMDFIGSFPTNKTGLQERFEIIYDKVNKTIKIIRRLSYQINYNEFFDIESVYLSVEEGFLYVLLKSEYQDLEIEYKVLRPDAFSEIFRLVNEEVIKVLISNKEQRNILFHLFNINPTNTYFSCNTAEEEKRARDLYNSRKYGLI